MRKSEKLVFFGNERLATGVSTTTPVLRGLANAGYDVAAVVASHSSAISRTARRLEIAEAASSLGIKLLSSDSMENLRRELMRTGAKAAVLVAYGKIIPASVIDVFKTGIINLHPSLLPKYRGPTPIETSILEGATKSGVSLMRLVPKMDAGPIYAQDELDLSGSETKQELADKLSTLGAELLIKNLPRILDGSLTLRDQDDSHATYTRLITKDDGIMDFSRPASLLEREVRAFAGWPRSIARAYGHKIIVTAARAAESEKDGDLVMRARPGWLAIDELIAPSGRTMNGAEFIRGYKKI